ncbi:type II toxin-antitoxin system VapC family toxin [Actinopolymorpha sp. B17G11]|uniref:type II toxin-antitoxin system VapC family toxin n=1 Tax=Actinopolymorpha sp. B17G11 TaxID=3160861 RepID=UPI0032E3E0FE
MKLVDINVLIYAIDKASPQHERARHWLGAELNGADVLGLPWLVLLGFVRLVTKPQVFAHPLPVETAMDLVDGWLQRENVVIPQPGSRHATILRGLLDDLGTGGNLVSDAHLAALAIEHGFELCSCDADFSRFSGLRWRDPLRDR